MAYATTIYPAKAALDELLRAHSWPGDPPDILWGAPTEMDDQTWDMIYQGSPTTIRDAYVGLGPRIDETFELTVAIDVHRYGDDEQATEARAWELFDGLMSVLTANQTLLGTVNRLTGFRLEPPAAQPSGPQQWRCQIIVRVQVVGIVHPL